MDKKIKVLIATPTLECGGAERFVSLLCDHIDVVKMDVTLVVINNSNAFFKITNPGVHVTDLKCSRVSGSFFKLKKIIRRTQPDIVFTTANHLNLFISIVKFLLPAKIVFVARETSVVSINARHARFPQFYRLLLKRFYKGLDHIICQSAFMQKDLVEHFGIDRKKTSVIYNAVDPALHLYDGPVKENTFITVARLSSEKGFESVLKVLAEIDKPFLYNIVGDGPEKTKLVGLCEELGLSSKVYFKGQKKTPFESLNASHIYLMGSRYEGFPNSVIEANAIGIPVVAKNVPGGIADIITDGKNGFLANNEEEFRNKIIQALSFPFNRKGISEDAKERFSISKMVYAIESLLSSLYALHKK